MSLDSRPDERAFSASLLSMKRLRGGLLPAALCGTGCAIAIYVMESSSALTAYPMAAIPFATSIVLVVSQPHAAPAGPGRWSAAT
jgi:hypothetical protein